MSKWYNTYFLISTSDYNDAMTGSIEAATELFGAGSPKIQNVHDAWCAVGVGSACYSAGINDLYKTSISIYPNPASSSVIVVSDGKPMH
jgi:bacillolysin